MTSLPLPIAAFLAGLVSFLSPCVLPLVPGYVSLISGVGVEQLKAQESQLLRKVMLNSVAFILGFSVVFITLGAVATEVSQMLSRYRSTLAQIAGVVIILFGLHLTGILQNQGPLYRRASAQRERRQHRVGSLRHRLRLRLRLDPVRRTGPDRHPDFRRRPGLDHKGHHAAGALLHGISRAFPADRSRRRALPEVLRRFRAHMHAIEVASGALLVVLGMLLVLGRFTIISNYLSFLNRFAL